MWDEERGILSALPGAFGATDDVVAASVTGPVTNRRSATSRVFTTGRPYLSNRASGDPGILQPYVELFDIARILSVPLDNGSGASACCTRSTSPPTSPPTTSPPPDGSRRGEAGGALRIDSAASRFGTSLECRFAL